MTEHVDGAERTESDPGDPGGGASGLLTAGSVAAVLLSAAVSLAAAGALPARVRIHWTLGIGPYYGPEFAPTPVVLALFPVLVAAVAAGGRLLAGLLDATAPESFAPVRRVYAAGVLGTLVLLLAVQAIVLGANL